MHANHATAPCPVGVIRILRLVMLVCVVLLHGCSSIQFRDIVPPVAAPVAAVTRPHLALVLGGGATRGFAHVGVIKVLESHGIHPDLVVGTSAGSFVGALYAGGYHASDLEAIALELEASSIRDVTFPNRGFVKGELLQDFINRKLDNRSLEELPLPLAIVATDLTSGKLAVFTKGNTGMAVRASSSIPGIFQPVQIHGQDYVDGGLVSPVPVNVAREMGADIVIAVDVSRKPENPAVLATTGDVLLQTIAIMEYQIAAKETAEADVVIRPTLQLSGLQGFDEKQIAISAGERAAVEALPLINRLLRTKHP